MFRELRRYLKARYFENKFFQDIDIITDRDEFRKMMFFSSLLNKGDRIIDIGANVGFFTTFFAKLVGPQGRVDAYEANPYVFKVLRKRTKRKKQIHTYHLAVSSSTGEELPLYIRPFELFYCGTLEKSMVTPQCFGNKKVEVKVKTVALDDCFREDPPPSMIKIDAEGHEDKIIEGASHLLREIRPLVVFEYLQSPSFVAYSPEIIGKYSYRILDNKTLEPFVRPTSKFYSTDLLAIPEERFAEFEKKIEAIKTLL